MILFSNTFQNSITNQSTMNIFGFKKCKVFFISPKLFLYYDDFSEFCCILGTIHFEKSWNTAKHFLENMKKNLPIILLRKWPLLEPKIFTVQSRTLLNMRQKHSSNFCSRKCLVIIFFWTSCTLTISVDRFSLKQYCPYIAFSH